MARQTGLRNHGFKPQTSFRFTTTCPFSRRALPQKRRFNKGKRNCFEFTEQGLCESHFGSVTSMTYSLTIRDGEPVSVTGTATMKWTPPRAGWAVLRGDERHGMTSFTAAPDSAFVAQGRGDKAPKRGGKKKKDRETKAA